MELTFGRCYLQTVFCLNELPNQLLLQLHCEREFAQPFLCLMLLQLKRSRLDIRSEMSVRYSTY